MSEVRLRKIRPGVYESHCGHYKVLQVKATHGWSILYKPSSRMITPHGRYTNLEQVQQAIKCHRKGMRPQAQVFPLQKTFLVGALHRYSSACGQLHFDKKEDGLWYMWVKTGPKDKLSFERLQDWFFRHGLVRGFSTLKEHAQMAEQANESDPLHLL